MPASSSLTAQCPECGKKYRLKEAAAVGKKMKCRNCETVFTAKPAGAQTVAEDSGVDDLDLDDFGDEPIQRLPTRRVPHPTRKKKVEKPEAVPDDELEKVRQKALKKQGKKQGLSPALIGASAVVAVGLLAVLVMVLRAPAGPSITVPTAFSAFTHEHTSFSCEYPSDWKMESGGNPGAVLWGRIEKGDAKISIKTSMAGGALGDIAGAFADPNETDDSLKPVSQVHETVRDSIAGDFSNYAEQSPFMMQSQRGEARVSEFTASAGLFGGKIRGYRATLLGGMYQLNVVCKCPEADWPVCKPVFEKVIQSLGN